MNRELKLMQLVGSMLSNPEVEVWKPLTAEGADFLVANANIILDAIQRRLEKP